MFYFFNVKFEEIIYIFTRFVLNLEFLLLFDIQRKGIEISRKKNEKRADFALCQNKE